MHERVCVSVIGVLRSTATLCVNSLSTECITRYTIHAHTPHCLVVHVRMIRHIKYVKCACVFVQNRGRVSQVVFALIDVNF